MDKLLIVRLSSLGDIIHAIPVATALRDAFPSAQIDWLVETRYRDLIESVSVLDHVLDIDFSSIQGTSRAMKTIRSLRKDRYDCAIDVQGLLKSAILAHISGADRTLGFSRPHLREKAACVFYTDVSTPQPDVHRIQKNLSLLKALNISAATVRFPIKSEHTMMPSMIRRQLQLNDQQPFILVIPGAGWPNKRWPASRWGELVNLMHEMYSLPTAIDRGNKEDDLAYAVEKVSGSTAHVAPKMSIIDLVAVIRAATLVVSGDTGPLHIAAAVGTPVVGIFGPTDPRQTGPWSPDDQTVSRHGECQCPYRRHCHATSLCIERIEVADVMAAIDRRLALVQKPSALAKDGETVVRL